MKNQKAIPASRQGFAQINLILVMIAVVGIGAFYFGAFKNKTSLSLVDSKLDLKPFTNDRYGFTFQYPARLNEEEKTLESETSRKPEKHLLSWIFRSNESQLGAIPPLDQQKLNEFDANTMIVGFDVYDNPHNLPLKDFIKSLYDSIGIDGKQTTFQIMDNQGFVLTDIPISESLLFIGTRTENPNKIYFFSKNKMVYQMLLVGGFGTGEKYSEKAEKEFDQILSTFKFLD